MSTVRPEWEGKAARAARNAIRGREDYLATEDDWLAIIVPAALAAVVDDIKAEVRPVVHLHALFEGDESLCGKAVRPERYEPDCPECLAEFERREGRTWHRAEQGGGQ